MKTFLDASSYADLLNWQILLSLIIVSILIVSIFQLIEDIINLKQWKYDLFPFGKQKKEEYYQLLCKRIGCHPSYYKHCSIVKLESSLNMRNNSIKLMRQSINRKYALTILGIKLIA